MSSSDSKYASPGKDNIESILYDAKVLDRNALVGHFIHRFPSIVLILNKQRQAVYMNQQLMEFLGASPGHELLGKRPGELFGCIHAQECVYGCGTTEFCSQCGAVNAILQSQQDKNIVEKECRITSTAGKAYDFRVWASPYNWEGKDYTLFNLLDISHEKRRQTLERMFFHDVNNLLGALLMASELVDSSNAVGDVAHSFASIKMISNKLAAEIVSYKKLLQAEDRQLVLELEPGIKSLEFVSELVRMFTPMRSNRTIIRAGKCDDFVMTTDRSLLYRILHNMVKNAVEASSEPEVVTIECIKNGSSGVFSVHNPGFMPRPTQLQVFQRSFSTKGKGRGIGTYSMKLFGEEYLKGKVWFSTSEEKGTTFFVSVPLSYEDI